MKIKNTLPLTALLGFTLAAGSAHGALLVYEGFDYTDVGNVLEGKGGTTETGLNGTWDDSTSSDGMFLKSGSLSFGNLQTSGNHIGFESNLNNDIYNRSLDSTATDGITSAGSANGSIWFSFLFEKLQNNNNADKEGFALMSDILPSARWDSGNDGAVGLHGFAVAAVDGSNLQAVAYDGTAGTRTVSAGSVPITVVNGSSNTSTSNQEVRFIVGELSFNTGTGGADVFNLYDVTAAGDGSLTLGSAVASIEADVDESTLDTLNLTRQVNVNYDEVRIGTTLESVMPVPEPSAFALLAGFLGLASVMLRRRA